MKNVERRDRFEKVASKRVQRVIDTLELLKNCSNRNNYDYAQEDVDLMFREINRALNRTKAAFSEELGKLNKQREFHFNK